jgi:RND family efflux transporter MFP subunit
MTRTRPIVTFLLGALAIPLPPAVTAQYDGYDCLIQPSTVTEVATRADGNVAEILVERGSMVVAGQVLARLESVVEEVALTLARARTNLAAELEELRATADQAQRRLERAEALFAKSAIPTFERDEANTDAVRAELRILQARQRENLAQLEYERAQKVLDQRTVRSPVDGIVMARLVEVGESVDDRPILTIASVDPLNVEVIIPVGKFGTIGVGDRAEITPAYPGATQLLAKVQVVDRVIDAASNTFGVRLELPNPDFAVPGGVRCAIRFLSSAGREE